MGCRRLSGATAAAQAAPDPRQPSEESRSSSVTKQAPARKPATSCCPAMSRSLRELDAHITQVDPARPPPKLRQECGGRGVAALVQRSHHRVGRAPVNRSLRAALDGRGCPAGPVGEWAAPPRWRWRRPFDFGVGTCRGTGWLRPGSQPWSSCLQQGPLQKVKHDSNFSPLAGIPYSPLPLCGSLLHIAGLLADTRQSHRVTRGAACLLMSYAACPGAFPTSICWP